MEPTLLIIAWQCVREIALAVIANRRSRHGDRPKLRPARLSDGEQTMKVSVDLEPRGCLAPGNASSAPRRRRGTCGR
jgi:uncharacterized protein with NRDE domain